jgi:hypothetical protein
MSQVYVFEASVLSYGRGRVVIYPLKEYQQKLAKHKGMKIKIIAVIEEEQS